MSNELRRITKTAFLQTVAEAAKEVPGIGSVMAALNGVYRGHNEAKFQTFLQEIGKPFAFGNVDTVVGYIADNIGEPWMVEGLERGWKTAQETLDPLARRCVYLMVADYMAEQRPPDRFHRQMGNLFMESDAGVLKIFLFIADHMRTAKFPETEVVWVYEHEVGVPPLYCRLILDRATVENMEQDGIEEATEILIRNSMAAVSTGMPAIPPMEPKFALFNIMCRISENHIPLWKRFWKYLEPLRVA